MTEPSPQPSQGNPAPSPAPTVPAQGLASPPIPSTPPASDPATPRAAKPDWLPDTAWDADKGAPDLGKLGDSFRDLAKFKSDEEARRAAVPVDPKDYQAKLPEASKLPDGWTINEADPLWPQARAFAAKAGLNQEQFSELAAMWIGNQVQQHKAVSDALANRDKALGPDGAQRVEAIGKWLEASFDAKTAGMMRGALFTPEIVTAFEKMKDGLVRQGVPGFTTTGRQNTADPGAIPGYNESGTFEQKMAAVRAHRAAAA